MYCLNYNEHKFILMWYRYRYRTRTIFILFHFFKALWSSLDPDPHLPCLSVSRNTVKLYATGIF